MPSPRFPRLRRRLGLELGDGRAFTSDIGPGGLALELRRAPTLGSTLRGALLWEGERYEFTAQVAWVNRGEARLGLPSRVGLAFTGIAHEFFRRLQGAMAPTPG